MKKNKQPSQHIDMEYSPKHVTRKEPGSEHYVYSSKYLNDNKGNIKMNMCLPKT